MSAGFNGDGDGRDADDVRGSAGTELGGGSDAKLGTTMVSSQHPKSASADCSHCTTNWTVARSSNGIGGETTGSHCQHAALFPSIGQKIPPLFQNWLRLVLATY